MADKIKESRFTKIKNEVVTSIVGVARLAFITASGVAAYVLIFSTDSLTLHGVAAVLIFRTACDALALSRSK